MEETDIGFSSPTTSTSTMLPSLLAGLLRLSQEDIAQIATVVAGLIRPPPSSGAELSSSSSLANPLQMLSSASSNAASNSSLVPTLLSSTTLQSCPGTKTGIGTLYRIYRVRIPVGRHSPKCCTATCDLATRLPAHTYYCSIRSNGCMPWSKWLSVTEKMGICVWLITSCTGW